MRYICLNITRKFRVFVRRVDGLQPVETVLFSKHSKRMIATFLTFRLTAKIWESESKSTSRESSFGNLTTLAYFLKVPKN